MLFRSMWKEGLDVALSSFSIHHIDVQITSEEMGSFRLTGVYGAPNVANRASVWEFYKSLVGPPQAWLMIGDFNEILSPEEKQGGRGREVWQMLAFQDFLSSADLKDLGFEGDAFTWSNMQYGQALIKARLDRAISTVDWVSLFPLYRVTHIASHCSDHHAVCVF